jgi:adenylate kinase
MTVPDEVVINRLAGRLTCRQCGATTHVSEVPDGVAAPCPVCHEKALFVRDDDREETIRARLGVYRHSTDPVIEVLGRHYPLRKVSGHGTPQEVATRLRSVLG